MFNRFKLTSGPIMFQELFFILLHMLWIGGVINNHYSKTEF